MTDPIALVVPEDTGERLDVFLAEVLEEVSRSKLESWCGAGLVTVDGRPRKKSFTLSGGESIEVSIPQEPDEDRVEAEEIPLEIVYEDEAIAVIDKAAGMVVHPGAGVRSGTLANAARWHFETLSSHGGSGRPGIVHRLDKGTTGLIVLAKTDEAHRELARQWQDQAVTKVYQALVWGVPDPATGELETEMGRHPRFRQMMAARVPGGRWAKTRFKTVTTFPEAARLNVQILTGRTHQIRVHLAYLGHPVIGDALYGRARHRSLSATFPQMPDHPMLHAALLRFRHPLSGEEVTFKRPPPDDFRELEGILARWP